MYQSETLDAVRDAAQQLTREGKVLTVGNPEFPLAVFADTYQVDSEPTNTELPQEEIVAVEEHFDEINQDSTPAVDNSREAIVNNLFNAVSKIQFNTTNIIIPAIKAMHTFYAGLQQGVSQAEYSVKPWRYLAPHDNPVLVNHVNTRYTTVRPKESYDTFELKPIGADAIIELMAINNPHMEQEEVTEWALQVGAERLAAVWHSLFGQPGPLVPAGLPYLQLQAAPFNVDDILAAYFICGHYIDNPEQVPGVSVDLDDWTHTMKCLHELFGFYLMRAYIARVEARESGELILRNEAINPIETRRAVVIVNGDVFDPWIIGGGDFQAVLGAAIENTGITEIKHIEANSDRLIARWHAIYPMIKQSAIDYADRQCINNVIATFRECSRQEPLRERWSQELEPKLKEALRYLRRDDYENPYKVFSTLICRVYFPESTYIEYLDCIDRFGQDYPKATVRELNTQATISLVAMFQAKQMVVEDFIPDIETVNDEGQMDNSGLLAVVDPEAETETAEVIDVSEGGESEGDVEVTDIEGLEGGDDITDEGLGGSDGDGFVAEVGDSAEPGDGELDIEVDTGGETTDTDDFGGDAETGDTDVGEDESDFGDDEEEDDPYAELEEDASETEVEETEGESETEESGETTEEESTETEEEESDESEKDDEDETPLA